MAFGNSISPAVLTVSSKGRLGFSDLVAGAERHLSKPRSFRGSPWVQDTRNDVSIVIQYRRGLVVGQKNWA